MKNRHVWTLILAGGAGTRFWPASRAARPKQLLPLLGGDALLLETARRVLPLCPWERVLVASGKHLAEATRRVVPELPAGNLLVEPVPRNTAPCIGWAAATVARSDPEGVLMVLPSDHHIADPDGFREVVTRAADVARTGVITTVGIQPTHPETGYGYIELEPEPEPEPEGGGGVGPASAGARAVKQFVEKPSRERAEQFLATGRYLWNAGMFFFRACDMVAAIRAHQPELARGLDVFDAAAAEGDEEAAVERGFGALPAVSIDHGVIEHVSRLAVVPGDFGWSDIGSWQAAWELAHKDEQGNSAPAGAVLVGSSNNHVVDLRRAAGAKRVISLVGVSDLVVVETDDALLIVPRERAQDVKLAVDALKARGDGDLT